MLTELAVRTRKDNRQAEEAVRWTRSLSTRQSIWWSPVAIQVLQPPMNRKALPCASGMAILCAAAMATLLTWPLTDSITWRPLTPPAWWQFEWLAHLGVLLSALPSFIVYKFDGFFAANEYLRGPVAGLLVLLEVLLLAYGTYKILTLSDQVAAPDRRNEASDEQQD